MQDEDGKQRLLKFLEERRLQRSLETLKELARQAERRTLSFEQCLSERIARECEDRECGRMNRFLLEIGIKKEATTRSQESP